MGLHWSEPAIIKKKLIKLALIKTIKNPNFESEAKKTNLIFRQNYQRKRQEVEEQYEKWFWRTRWRGREVGDGTDGEIVLTAPTGES